jgi:glycosyltransferase involved in cell wall biosynthesis
VAVDRGVARHATRVVAVSEAVRTTLTQREGIEPASVDVVYNGYDWEDLAPSAQGVQCWRDRFPGRRLVVAAGRLDPIKDLPTLLRAVALASVRHPALTLVLAGSGPVAVQRELQALAAELGIADRVAFVGYVDPLHDLVAAADVFAQASLDEACSQTISEAIGLGVPVAVTTTGGTHELVGDLQQEIPAGQPALLARRIEELLDDPATARVRAAVAAPAARRRFSTTGQLDRYRGIYEAVTGR